MNRNIFIYSLLFLTAASLSFAGCNHPFFITTEECIEISVPSWPPETSPTTESITCYPELSRWQLKTGSTSQRTTQYLAADTKTISLTVSKNQPFSAVLQPITKTTLPKSPETAYFNPAGFIYPYKADNLEFTWSQGYLATAMLRVLNSQAETGVSQDHMLAFLNSFNWKKAQETIEKKLAEADSTYNPWLIDTARFLENLCYGYFKASFLNLTGCYSYNTQSLFQEEKIIPLSPFIPENSRLQATHQIILKKETPTLLSDGNQIGAVITFYSAKKISKEIIYLPIFIEDI